MWGDDDVWHAPQLVIRRQWLRLGNVQAGTGNASVAQGSRQRIRVYGLAAADEVTIPIQCEYYALEGVSQLMRNVQLVQQSLNSRLEVEGVILTMFDGRTTLAADVVEQVREHFGETTYKTVIPRTVRLSEAPSYGEPIEAYDPMSRGAIAYRELAREFRRRHGRT